MTRLTWGSLVFAALAACSGGGGQPPDAAPDAPAVPDASVDAAPTIVDTAAVYLDDC